MLPGFTRQGLLPPGVHRAGLAEVIERFGKGSRQRVAVTERLRRILALAQRGGCLRGVYLWGSYVTVKPDPNDVDVMLVMAPDFHPRDCGTEARSVFDGDTAQSCLGATVVWLRENAPPGLLQGLLELWQAGRAGEARGIVEVVLQ